MSMPIQSEYDIIKLCFEGHDYVFMAILTIILDFILVYLTDIQLNLIIKLNVLSTSLMA